MVERTLGFASLWLRVQSTQNLSTKGAAVRSTKAKRSLFPAYGFGGACCRFNGIARRPSVGGVGMRVPSEYKGSCRLSG